MGQEPTSLYLRSSVTEHGIAYGVRALWQRSAHTSRGGHVPPGSLGEPGAGRRSTGDRDEQLPWGMRMQNAETVL